MCGICGIISLVPNKDPSELRLKLSKMTSLLAHRGPDSQGLWDDSTAFLGHRRLSIIDIAGSNQPLVDVTGRYVLVFNGEIYNYLELRSELLSYGATFKTDGDSEVILEAYKVFGSRCLDKFNGMFAFCIWDKEEKRLFAARDRLGQKPFYFAQLDDLFFFSSELLTFRGLFAQSLNTNALFYYLRTGFIWGPQTVFNEVSELSPGHYLELVPGKANPVTICRYWMPEQKGPLRKDFESSKQELRDLVLSSVKIRLRSDVPLGAFLSGGLDSTIISASMKVLGVDELHTFSIAFEQKSFDESQYAKEVAKYLSTIHHELTANLDPKAIIFDLVKHYGQPFGDSSAIPTWHLSRLTRRFVTVALSGDGADELFGGYRRYGAAKILNWYKMLPRPLIDLVARIVEGFREDVTYYGTSLTKKLKLFVGLEKRLREDPFDYFTGYFLRQEAEQLLDKRFDDFSSRHQFSLPLLKGLGIAEQMMLLDIYHYLPDDILTKVDRASMAHALEVRSPFMDYRLVEFALSLPLEFKLRGMEGKYILRKSFEDMIPKKISSRPKHGFSVPVGNWFRDELAEFMNEIFSNRILRGLLNIDMVFKLLDEHKKGWKDHGHRLWLLLFLGVWYLWWNEEE